MQGEIIAAAIAASATVDSDVITVNPDRLLELQTGDAMSPLSFFDPSLEFPINPERVAPLLRNLVTPTRTRARIYDQRRPADPRQRQHLCARRGAAADRPSRRPPSFFLADWWNTVMSWVPGDDFPPYQEYRRRRGHALSRGRGGADRRGRRRSCASMHKHQLVVSVAVPVQRVRATVGVLLLSTAAGRYRPHRRRPSAGASCASRWSPRRDHHPVAAARRHHRRAAAPAVGGGRGGADLDQQRAPKSRISPTAPTRSATSAGRCAR